MVLTTSTGTDVVVAAVFHTLVAPFLADVKGEGLRVFSDVRGYVVLADAGVGECIRVTVILDGGHGGDAGLLEADERTLGFLVITPGLPVRLCDVVWVDGVGVVLLRRVLSGREAGQGDKAESEDRPHRGGW